MAAGEALPVENETVSLLQVAAAAHWMDLAKFYKEADRVLTPGGVVTLYCYAGPAQALNHPKSAEVKPILHEVLLTITMTVKFILGTDFIPFSSHCNCLYNIHVVVFFCLAV